MCLLSERERETVFLRLTIRKKTERLHTYDMKIQHTGEECKAGRMDYKSQGPQSRRPKGMTSIIPGNSGEMVENNTGLNDNSSSSR